MSVLKLYIKDNTNGHVHEYGTNRHDALILQEDGSLHYENLQNSTGTAFPDEGYSFCRKDGTIPGWDERYDAEPYVDIGGCSPHVTYECRVSIYESLLARYGTLLQSIVALEELSECQKEICKCLRDKGDIEHLAEEVADATIMLEQIRHMYQLDDKVSHYMDEKVQRMIDKLSE